MRYVFDPQSRGAWFKTNGQSIGNGVRVVRGDVVELSDGAADRVRQCFGAACLRPEGAVVLNGIAGAVPRAEFDALRQQCEFHRLAALALSRSASDRKAMAVAVGAAVNADADAQRDALLSLPSDITAALDAMAAVARGWA